MELSAAGEIGTVTLVYVDHQLRDDTELDHRAVSALARRGRAEFLSVAIDVDRQQASLEEAARTARYRALHQAAEAASAEWILTAHTASDQAETVLMRILRGAGVVGLAGIPASRGQILRPLLEVSRSQVEGVATLRGLEPVADSTNRDLAFTRNRIRHQLLPQLRLENPNIESALRRLARAAREESEVLDYAAGCLLERAAPTGTFASVLELARAPVAVAKRALTQLADRAGHPGLEARHLDALIELVGRPNAGSVSLDLPGFTVIREYDRLDFGGPAQPHLPVLVVQGPLPSYLVRNWEAGDRMRPARLKGRSKKLSDLFGDAGIPRSLRATARIVARPNGVIEWAEHLGLAWQSEVTVLIQSD